MNFMKNRQRYIVTHDADRIAPDWLAVRINYDTVNFIYQVVDGAVQLKGVRIGHEIAKINDVIVLKTDKLCVEGRRSRISH